MKIHKSVNMFFHKSLFFQKGQIILPIVSQKMKTRERQENAMETRSVTRGDLTEIGRSTRAKKSFIKNIDNSQKGNPRALQVTTHLGLAILSK